MNVRWTRRAAFDLAAIATFIVADNPVAAKRLVKSIRASAKKLARFPRMGRVVPEFGDETVREIVVGNYRIVYRIGEKTIDVLTVFEGHRLMPVDLRAPDGSD
ncbi:MAG: type II toxin-antitoxin system RelE/ParE family toxin [Deltaproteobacteria bacterium]|nr:type II toxin-antitoxin system RelE/ParE family toxin [Deltaproteobacteria bacterium]